MSLIYRTINTDLTDDCRICYEPLQNEQVIAHSEGEELHPIHLKCMFSWIERAPLCPFCMRTIQTDSIINIRSLKQRVIFIKTFIISQAFYSIMFVTANRKESYLAAGITGCVLACLSLQHERFVPSTIRLLKIIREYSWETLASIGIGTAAACVGRTVQLLHSDSEEYWSLRLIEYTASAVAGIAGVILADQYKNRLFQSIVCLKQKIDRVLRLIAPNPLNF